jgi:SlyX protein
VEEKLIELETKFSYQEDLLSELNSIVSKQQRQLDELLKELRLVKEQLQEAVGQGAIQGEFQLNEKPPHY